jgi:hypothetical protein
VHHPAFAFVAQVQQAALPKNIQAKSETFDHVAAQTKPCANLLNQTFNPKPQTKSQTKPQTNPSYF